MKKAISILLALLLLLSVCGASFAETKEEGDALRSAKSYLSFMAFSRKGLIEQLEFEGYSNASAVYAADHCEADWFEQAAKSAASYLSFMSFSTDGLISQLEFEGFTHEEAVYGVNNYNGAESGPADQKEQALGSAKSYLSFSAFSYSGLIKQLEFEGYTHEDAVYAADHCGADWFEQAAKSAASYLSFMSFSRKDLIKQLEFEGFSKEEAEYGVKQNGL